MTLLQEFFYFFLNFQFLKIGKPIRSYVNRLGIRLKRDLLVNRPYLQVVGRKLLRIPQCSCSVPVAAESE